MEAGGVIVLHLHSFVLQLMAFCVVVKCQLCFDGELLVDISYHHIYSVEPLTFSGFQHRDTADGVSTVAGMPTQPFCGNFMSFLNILGENLGEFFSPVASSRLLLMEAAKPVT